MQFRICNRSLASKTGLFAVLSASILLIPARIAAAETPHSPVAATNERQSIVGSWEGSLGFITKMRLVFHIRAGDNGTLSATFDSPDQGAMGLKIDEVAVDDGVLRMEAKAIGGVFSGKLDNDNREITGAWKQSGQTLPLVLKPASPPKRPQVPLKPYPYDEEEVTFENRAAGVKLAGTLTLPRDVRPVPAAILISGSGPQDRDEALAGHRPFLVLADDLTRRGVAVLRCDDRGVGGSSGKLDQSTTDDLVGDVLAAVEFLRCRSEIDPERIGLVGHSEGGLIAPAAAARSSHIAFIVMMAGPGVTGEEILYEQGTLILRAAGASLAAIAQQRSTQEELFAIIKDDSTPDANSAADTEKKLTAAILAASGTSGPDDRAAVESAAAAQARAVMTPWFRYFLTYDPRPTLAKVRCPVLAVIGERDLQVAPGQNLPEIRKALEAAGHQDHTLSELAGLNHLLQPCKTGSPTEYGQIETTIAPEALEAIGAWIVAHTKR